MSVAKKIIYFTLLVLGVGGLILWDVIAIRSVSEGFSWLLAALLCVIGVVIMFLFGVFLHEIGHLLFGLMGKMRFRSISLPFIKIYKVGEKIRAKFNFSATFLGVCEMFPSSLDATRGFAFMAAGGPVGSLVALAVSITFLALSPSVGAVPLFLFGVSAPLLYLIFLENAFPASIGGANTDGQQLLSMAKKTPSAVVLAAVLKMQAAFYEGYTPSQIDEDELFNLPQLPCDDPSYMFLLNARYLYYLDKGDLDGLRDVDARLNDIIEDLPYIYAEQLVCDLFFNSLFINPNPTYVTANKDAVFKRLEQEELSTACRIRGYFYLRAGDFEKALCEAETGVNAVSSHPMTGIGKMESKLLNQLKELAKK